MNEKSNGFALITGGSSGIGLETVLRFSRQGYQVITCARRSKNWQSQVSKFPELATVDFYPVDLTSEEKLEDFFATLRGQGYQLSIAVNNASPKIQSIGLYTELDNEKLRHTADSDFWAHALCLKHELQMMEAGGAIVNVTSTAGFRPAPNAVMYSAAKHAMHGLTKSMALQVIEKGIRINAVAPGATWTPRWEERTQDFPTIEKDAAEHIPIKRFATSEEVANAIEWLCSDKASYVVGHTLVVDGGLSLYGSI